MDNYNWIVRNRTRYTGSSTYGSDYISKSAIIDRPNRNYRPAAYHKPISPPFVSKKCQFGCGISKFVGLKNQDFCQKSTNSNEMFVLCKCNDCSSQFKNSLDFC